jgi:hypothetical protein
MNIKKIIDRTIREFLNEGLEDKWTHNDTTVTLRQILDVTKNIPVTNISTDILKSKVLNWDGNPEEIKKIEKSDLQYPVLIIVNNNNDILYILDGNHRIQKAIMNKIPTVVVKLIKLSELPKEFQYVLG